MTAIQMIDVQSGNLKAIGYDEGREVLYVSFVSGPTYRYKCVPKSVYNDLLAAHNEHKSVGSLFMGVVNGKFEHQKVWG